MCNANDCVFHKYKHKHKRFIRYTKKKKFTEYINPTQITGIQIKMRLHQFYVPHQQKSGFFKNGLIFPTVILSPRTRLLPAFHGRHTAIVNSTTVVPSNCSFSWSAAYKDDRTGIDVYYISLSW